MENTSNQEKTSFFDRKFGFTAKGSSLKTEIVAGITTFLAMAYILIVNAGMFNDLSNVSFDAIYVTTAISAIVGTVLIGLLANLPLAQAPGMGLNAFFVYTVCFALGFSYANALVFVLLDGIIFILLTVTGLRKIIFEAIPHAVKAAIPAGIGLFIAFLGLQDSGLVIPSESTGVTLASFNLLSGSWEKVMPLIVAVISILLIAVLSVKKVKGSILWGILGGAALYYLLGLTVPGFYQNLGETMSLNPIEPFKAFGKEAFGKVFTEGFDFTAYLAVEGHSVGGLVIAFITTSLAFCMVDMFDTMGTLYGACRSGNLLVDNGKGERSSEHGKSNACGRDRDLHRRGFRHFHRNHVRGIFLGRRRGRQNGILLARHGGYVPRRAVPCSRSETYTCGCLRRRARLRGNSHDRLR